MIGQPLPIACVRSAIPTLLQRVRRNGGLEAARAIMTTDLKPKQMALSAKIGGQTVTLGGMAKGSGMIHPNLATMLAYLTTDACITRRALQQALKTAVSQSFNSISVDGDTSTNDTVLCLSNGMACNARIDIGTPGFYRFQKLLDNACHSLALQVCWDGEGVTKVVKIVVAGAKTARAARQVSHVIATSSLVKTALFGGDANWGRIMAAIGRAGVPIDPAKVALKFDDVAMVKNGQGLGSHAERRLSRVFHRKEFTIRADLGQGTGTAHMWTTDLSYDYVRINASYRS